MTARHLEADHGALLTALQLKDRWGTAENLNSIEKKTWSLTERVAIWVTDRIGSMTFFVLIVVWTVVWLGWNSLGPHDLRFDPAPTFAVWVFVSNLIQLHLMPLIMVGQNLQDHQSMLRAELDFEVNRRAEAGVQAVLDHLGHQNDALLEILRRLERLESSR